MVAVLCRYKDALGVPGKGIHSYRIMNIAVVDVALTLLGAWVLAYALGVVYWKMAVGLFVLGIVMHRMFCVKTTVDKLLFGE